MTRLILRAGRVASIGVNAMVEASPIAADMRQPVAMYLLVTGCGLPGAVVAQLAGCTKQNVSKHLKRIEAAREDREFDRDLVALEEKLFGGE